VGQESAALLRGPRALSPAGRLVRRSWLPSASDLDVEVCEGFHQHAMHLPDSARLDIHRQ
jgi:hypothetical protein